MKEYNRARNTNLRRKYVQSIIDNRCLKRHWWSYSPKSGERGIKADINGAPERKLDALVKEFGADNAIGVAADAGNYDQLAETVKQGVDKFGQLDAVFANAGTGVSTAGTEEGDTDEWKSMVDVNINGLLYTAKLTLPHLRKTTGHF